MVLNIDSLELRRLKADLLLTYKIIFSLVDVDCENYFTLRRESITRGHRYRIIPECSVINRRRNFFSNRVCNAWNSLPSSIVNFESFSTFKNSLNKINLRIFTRHWLYLLLYFNLSIFLQLSLWNKFYATWLLTFRILKTICFDIGVTLETRVLWWPASQCTIDSFIIVFIALFPLSQSTGDTFVFMQDNARTRNDPAAAARDA